MPKWAAGRRPRIYWMRNLDGLHEAVVAAATLVEALELLGISANTWRKYGGQWLNSHCVSPLMVPMIAAAMARPGQVLIRRIYHGPVEASPPWRELVKPF